MLKYNGGLRILQIYDFNIENDARHSKILKID